MEALQEVNSEKSGGIPKQWKVEAFLNNGKEEEQDDKSKSVNTILGPKAPIFNGAEGPIYALRRS